MLVNLALVGFYVATIVNCCSHIFESPKSPYPVIAIATPEDRCLGVIFSEIYVTMKVIKVELFIGRYLFIYLFLGRLTST